MEENVRIQEELSLGEIFKILWGKIKLLLLVLLVGVVAGAGIGVLTTFNVKYYGTSMEFYVNPTKESTQTDSNSEYGVYGTYSRPVMDNIVRLLGSDSFAEQLLLDEDGMPKFRDEDKQAELDEAIEVARPLKQEAKAKEDKLTQASKETVKAQLAYNERAEEWAIELNLGSVSSDEKVAYFETVTKELTDAKLAEKNAQNELNEVNKIANVETQKVYELYRQTPIYQSLMKTINESVTYSYYKTVDDDAVEALAKSFIYVEISILNNEKLANDLYNQILNALPSYVMSKMPIPTGYSGTSCQRITRMDEVKRTNEGYVLSTAIKYALVLGVVALGIACVAVVIIERSNKKLKDYETTMEKLKVPVLGVIPSISEVEDATEDDAGSEK